MMGTRQVSVIHPWRALGLATIAALALGVVAETSAQGLTGVYCARGGDDALVVEERGQSLNFMLSSWQGGMHHCGTGRLTATAQVGGFAVTDGACTLRLREDGLDILLEAAPFEACKQQYCGARAALDTLRLPLSSRRPLPMPFDQISMMETPVCR